MTISLFEFAFAAFCGKRQKMRSLTSMLNSLVLAKKKREGKKVILGANLVKFHDFWSIFHVPSLSHDHFNFPGSLWNLF